MGELKKDVAKLYDLDGDWDEVIFTCHNPTNSDVLFNLFDPLVVQQINIPNTPTGYVQPPVVEGTGSGSPAPPPYPAVAYYPNGNVTDTYPIPDVNNTMAYDSVHSRMYMTYKAPFTSIWFLTFTPFTVVNVPIISAFPALDVVDTAISTTSNKIFVLSSIGEIFVFSTITNTLITTFTLPTFLGVHSRIEWNSVKDTFYITASGASQAIVEVSAVTMTTVATVFAPVATIPFAITFKASTNEMFVTYSGTSQIAKINCTLNTISTIIGASITATPNAILYNPITDLVTYGSDVTSGVRTFNATSLIFLPSVIPNTVLDIALYSPDNKIYFLEALGVANIIIADGVNLSVVENVATASTFGTRAEIKTFPPTDQMYYNFYVTIVFKSMSAGRLIRPTVLFWIDGSAGYNFSVRDFFNSPAWVRRIYMYSKDNEENFKQVINHIYKDANGIEVQIPLIPSLSVGINQFQGWIGELDFPNHETVFGINQWFQNVLIKKNSELTMLLIYKQIDKTKLLAISGEPTIFDDSDICPNKLQKWSERDLYLNDYLVATPFKQNMYLGQKEDAVRPFDFSILKMYQGKSV